jgi:hypothetical protein
MTAQSMISRLDAMPRDRLLRLALAIDATVTGANGVVYVALAGPLEDLLGTPPSLLRSVGACLVFFAGIVALIAARSPIPARPGAGHRRGQRALGSRLGRLRRPCGFADRGGDRMDAEQAAVVAAFAAVQRAALPRA